MAVIQGTGGGTASSPLVVKPPVPTLAASLQSINVVKPPTFAPTISPTLNKILNPFLNTAPSPTQTSLQSINFMKPYSPVAPTPPAPLSSPLMKLPSVSTPYSQGSHFATTPSTPSYLRSITGGGTDNFKGAEGLNYGNAFNFVVQKYIATGDQSYMPGQVTLQELPTLQQQLNIKASDLEAAGYLNAGPAGYVKPPGGLTPTNASGGGGGGGGGGYGSYGSAGSNGGGYSLGLVNWRI